MRRTVGEWNGLRLWADFSKDKLLDTAYGRPGGPLEVNLGLDGTKYSDAVVTQVDVSALSSALVVDIDADSHADIVGIARTGPPDETHDSIVTVLFGDGLGGFSAPEQGFRVTELLTSLAYADFNCDGLADLILVGPQSLSFRILIRDKAGGWMSPIVLSTSGHPSDQDIVVAGNLSVAAGDFNGDGAHDLVVSPINYTASGEHRGHLIVYYGNGDGQFDAPDFLESSDDGSLWVFVTAADLNGDGLDDFITSAGYPSGAVEFTPEFSIWTAVREN